MNEEPTGETVTPEQASTQFVSDEGATIQAKSSEGVRGPGVMPLVGIQARYFGRYRTVRELGRGGMGVVLLAHDEELGLPVALKILPDMLARDVEAVEALKKEVLRGMALMHPAIVRVHNLERDGGHVAIVMEYIQGETLAERRVREPGGCFDCAQILPWIEQLCAVLDYAHTEAQIAHRDLKPRNVMIGRDGRVKVADFGMASGLSESLSHISVRSDASGTPPYMSPQQVMGQPATRFDDLYALGATIYELLTGRPPFFRGNVLAQVLQETPPLMAARRVELGVTDKAEIPVEWEDAIARCLAKDPQQRPQSGATLVAQLHSADMRAPGPLHVRIVPPPHHVSFTERREKHLQTGPNPIPSPHPLPLKAADAPTRSAPTDTPRWRRTRGRHAELKAWFRSVALVIILAAATAGAVSCWRHRDIGGASTTRPEAAATNTAQRESNATTLKGAALQPSTGIRAVPTARNTRSAH
jgi:serine/threonine protein kinase